MSKTERVPVPNIESVRLVEQVARGLIADIPIDAEKKSLFESSLHDATNKKLLFIEALRTHMMNYHAQLLAAKQQGMQFLQDRQWMKGLAKSDPGKFLKAMELLDKMDERFTKFYLETAGLGAETEGGFDARQVFGKFFGVGSQAILPDSFKDQKNRREFREGVQGLLDILSGKSIPKPPERESRIIDAKVVVGEPKNDA